MIKTNILNQLLTNNENVVVYGVEIQETVTELANNVIEKVTNFVMTKDEAEFHPTLENLEQLDADRLAAIRAILLLNRQAQNLYGEYLLTRKVNRSSRYDCDKVCEAFYDEMFDEQCA